jgi:hypothetical protein
MMPIHKVIVPPAKQASAKRAATRKTARVGKKASRDAAPSREVAFD